MISPTYGAVEIEDIANIIREKIERKPGEYCVVIGTDSQNFDETKVVVVIAVHHVGHGGSFFYDVQRVRRITNIGQKLLYETHLSLACAEKLIAAFDRLRKQTGFDISEYADLSIHVDAGRNGPSSKVIPEIVGWVTACGYHVVVKPDSFAASCIADRISK